MQQIQEGACSANHARILGLVQVHSNGWAYRRLYSGPDARDAVGAALEAVTPQDCQGCFASCGYLRTDNASWTFSRQRIVDLLASRSDNASRTWVAELTLFP